MGKSVNKVTIIGTLGRDPEMKYMPNGNAVANISVATDESYNDKQSGQKVEKTEWHRLTAYGKLAEIIGQYLKKGSKAYFEGKLQTREWEKDGIKRYTTEIITNDMMMLDGKQEGQQGGFAQQAPQQGGFQPQQPAQQGGFQQQAQPQYNPNQPPPPPANQPMGVHQAGQQNQFNQQGDFDPDLPF